MRATRFLHHQTGLLGQFLLHSSLAALLDVHRLVSDDTATPLTGDLLVVVEGGLHRFAEDVQVFSVLLGNVDDARGSAGLLTDQLSQSGLGLHHTVRNVLLAAEGRKPNNQFDRINIMGDDNQSGLLGLDQFGDVVNTELQHGGGLGVGGLGTSHVLETLLLVSLGLGGQLLAQTSQLLELGLIASVRELSDAWRDLDTLHEDSLLALKADVLRPLDEASQVSLGLDGGSDTEGTSLLFEQRVLLDLLGSSTRGGNRSLRQLLLGRGGLLSGEFLLRHFVRWFEFFSTKNKKDLFPFERKR